MLYKIIAEVSIGAEKEDYLVKAEEALKEAFDLRTTLTGTPLHSFLPHLYSSYLLVFYILFCNSFCIFTIFFITLLSHNSFVLLLLLHLHLLLLHYCFSLFPFFFFFIYLFFTLFACTSIFFPFFLLCSIVCFTILCFAFYWIITSVTTSCAQTYTI
jgi:hypothetical protein